MTTTITARVSGTPSVSSTTRVAVSGDVYYFATRYFNARYFKARHFHGGSVHNVTIRVTGTPTSNHTIRVTGL